MFPAVSGVASIKYSILLFPDCANTTPLPSPPFSGALHTVTARTYTTAASYWFSSLSFFLFLIHKRSLVVFQTSITCLETFFLSCSAPLFSDMPLVRQPACAITTASPRTTAERRTWRQKLRCRAHPGVLARAVSSVARVADCGLLAPFMGGGHVQSRAAHSPAQSRVPVSSSMSSTHCLVSVRAQFRGRAASRGPRSIVA